MYADVARSAFTQPIVVVNKPGAIGSIGIADVAAAKPDGYKILMVTPELLIAPHMGIGRATADAFIPVARLNADPSAITVRADAPWKSVDEFLAHARANPGKVSVSTSGIGAVPDIAALEIEEKTGTKLLRVPYQGEAPAIQAILGGQVDATVVSPGALSTHVKAGKLRVLAVTAAARIHEFAEVPTFKERGVDVVIGTWRGLMLPAGTPAAIVKQWQDLTQKVSADPKYQEALRKMSINQIYEGSEAFAAVLKQDGELYKRLVPRLQVSTK
jgi:tripartite-type tricarboxylate transporter receptor subunit TctC